MQKKGILVLLICVAVGVSFALAQSNTTNQAKTAPFHSYSSQQRNFIDFLRSRINQVNNKILRQRQKFSMIKAHYLQTDKISTDHKAWLTQLAQNYRIKNPNFHSPATWLRLTKRIDIVPLGLVLAQAANESAWGRSRFAKQGHNYFGTRCFSKGCGIVPRRRDPDKSYEVRRFSSAFASVKNYIHNLNTNHAYRELRQIRYQMRQKGEWPDGITMARGLKAYSQRGEHYVKSIRKIISAYKLAEFSNGNT